MLVEFVCRAAFTLGLGFLIFGSVSYSLFICTLVVTFLWMYFRSKR